MILPIGTRLDGYVVEEHLATGAEAEVYRASEVVTGAPVVLKVVHDSVVTQPILGARWRRETRLMNALDHERVQCLVDRGRRHSRPYLALEYVPGGSLRKWLSHHGPVPIEQAVTWGRQLAEALGYVHALGIIHRDLKPENVLLTAEADLKLGDFGAAARYSTWLPWRPPEPPEGTAGYVSPEIVGGQRGDPRSDVYGWGVLMYELLTGECPFSAPPPLELLNAPLTEHPRRLRELRPDVPPALEALVLTAMRRQPDHRYRDTQALDADLKRIDQLDASSFDLSPEPAFSVGASEFQALVRFAAVLSASFVALVAVVIVLTILL
jgi:eukaryotic-like serine/threonine-protein kinase